MNKLYKRLFSYAEERKKWAYISMLLSAISVFIFMSFYWYLWEIFEEVLVGGDFSKASHYGILVVVLMIFRGIVAIVGTMCSHYLGFRLETNLRREGLYKLLDASFSFFDSNNSGQIRKIIDDNAGNTHKTVAHLIPDNISAILTPILMLTMTFVIDYRLGILLIVTTFIGVWQYKKMYSGEDLMEKFNLSLEEMSAATVEYIRGMQVIKVFGITVKFYKTLIDSILNYRNYVYEYSLSCRRPYVSFQVLFNIYYAIAVPFAVVFISRGEPAMLILAKVIFFAVFSGLMFMSFMAIMFTGMDNFSAKQAIDKLENLIESMDKEKLQHGNEKEFSNFDIEFKDIDFKYDKKYVLKDFNLKLEENKTYALVGSSGGGKSTIAKLISGFYPVNKGELLIGGKNIETYSEESLLKNIAFVFQNSKLFKTTIYENVRIGNPSATKDDVMEALKLAKCNNILEKFPERENTIIGSKGVHLSGGEIQRIAIARAMLKDAKIVIMDEASAATDPENEYELQEAFSQLMKNKTVIMIAHRLSSIRNVDEILFIENGQVVERGTDFELMNKNGRYKEFQDMYSRANEWRII